MNEKTNTKQMQLLLSPSEHTAIKHYCNSNGLKLNRFFVNLALNEIAYKSKHGPIRYIKADGKVATLQSNVVSQEKE